MVGMRRPDTTVQFCNPRQTALPIVVPQLGTPGWGKSGPMGDQSMGAALLWDGEAENLNKVAAQPWTT